MYKLIQENGFPIKAWINGVDLEDSARQQLLNVAKMPFIHKHIAVMPDCHWGMGATIGSVIATTKAIIPAAVGVDLGCGMMACQTSLKASQLPDNLFALRCAIEAAVPHGRTDNGGNNDRGAWGKVPDVVFKHYNGLCERLMYIGEKIYNKSKSTSFEKAKQRAHKHLGTLGTGNHFIEICLDENQNVWIMLHSGSRGIGNKIGTHFIELAKKDMERWMINLPDKDLAYMPEGSEFFDDYVEAVSWSQDFALENRRIMMELVQHAIIETLNLDGLSLSEAYINCHHNYISKENHFGKNVWVTRKGAVRAREGDWGIIPGSMGTKSYIVKGKGNKDSFESCSHGAGRNMSRNAARNKFTLEEHAKATEGVECRKDNEVIDETPMAYKDIDAVMEAQSDLVDVHYTLKQILCVKG